jgi:hypothetical protein
MRSSWAGLNRTRKGTAAEGRFDEFNRVQPALIESGGIVARVRGCRGCHDHTTPRAAPRLARGLAGVGGAVSGDVPRGDATVAMRGDANEWWSGYGGGSRAASSRPWLARRRKGWVSVVDTQSPRSSMQTGSWAKEARGETRGSGGRRAEARARTSAIGSLELASHEARLRVTGSSMGRWRWDGLGDGHLPLAHRWIYYWCRTIPNCGLPYRG